MEGINSVTIIMPDDFHHHLRDNGEMTDVSPLKDVLFHIQRSFARILVMPNIKPPIRTLDDAISYKSRILHHVHNQHDATTSSKPPVEFLMTLYLTDVTSPEEIVRAKESNIVFACKLYPAGATTNSEFGVSSLENLYPALEKMSEVGLPLCIHGEIVDSSVDIFDKEKIFIDRVLKPLITRFPSLKIVMEHITTADAVDFVSSCDVNVCATITAHHLLYNRNDIFKGGICPHMYCLPILKREHHRLALLKAATSGNPKFFIGTDSAPHSIDMKESSCGCAGIFTAHAAIELYAEAFDSVNALDKLEGFLSIHGACFYGLPINHDMKKIKLVRMPWRVPESYPFGSSVVIPLRASQEIQWSIVSE